MRLIPLVLALALCGGATDVLAASVGQLAIANPALKGRIMLQVSSPVLKNGGPVADVYSSYGASISPPLSWRGVPAGTKAFAVMLEDPDAPMATPFVHWVMWNVPAADRGLDEGKAPQGAVEGKMGAGRMGYFGPRPPAGPAHHYHFEVFALDQPLALQPGDDAKALEAAMAGHVLASGELVPTYQKR
jgi:Raf kinase inhibitor-like YbhB/YbcL family protein